jgi:glycosyltransferase involved in cell wall biosynthesis
LKSEPVTIVIPTRDRPDFLENCLRSVFEHQTTVPDVIVSDNSTSDHPAVHALQRKYGFRYVRQSGELSPTEHFNVCLQLPSSPWVWMVHDDDELCPESVGKMDSLLAQCGDVGLVVCGVRNIDQQGNVLGDWFPKSKQSLRGEAGLLSFGLDFGVFSPSTVVSAAASRQIGGFVEVRGLPADYVFLCRLAYSHGAAFFPELIGRYRYGPHQATDFSTPKSAENWLDFGVEMAQELIRATQCSASTADRLLDYMTWGSFVSIMPGFLKSHPSFVFGVTKKYLELSPRRGEWQNEVRRRHPLLFWRPQSLACHLHKGIERVLSAAKHVLPIPVRRWLRAKRNYLSQSRRVR